MNKQVGLSGFVSIFYGISLTFLLKYVFSKA